ncbi:MAG: hypothetical protein A2020_08215 [Lentisphaerae bacterium GWF2_45_14]|nr:MAG: hypothetical protein A2020_08215 [Lentisphaerae bacterium GWF2_45_14]
MLTRELIAQVKKVEIRTRRIVDEITGGAYHSVFKGRGIEFDEVREYSYGDDVRSIDWNVTARMGDPYIKKYVEERELTVILAVDCSASGLFGSGEKSKKHSALEIASLLAFSAIRNNDKVGLLMFSEKPELYLPPRSGRVHGLRLVRELLAHEPESKSTNIACALENLTKVLHKKSVVFLLSDLISQTPFEKELRIAARRHDLISVRILDPLELSWPLSNGLVLEDSENGTVSFFPGSSSLSTKFESAASAYHESNVRQCRKAGVDMIDIRCGEDIVKPLVGFFRNRRSRLAR